MQQLGISASILALAAAGCATVDPTHDYRRATDLIRESTGAEHVFNPSDEAAVAARVDELTPDGLSAADAIEICLLNNAALQSLFYRIGIARADVVQSQLLSNPSIGVTARFPDGGGLANIEASLAQNIVDLWQLPLRKRVAEQTLNRVILEVAREAARLAADTAAAYYRSLAAQRLVEIDRENRSAAQQLVTLTESLREAGAVSSVDVNLSLAELQNTELELRHAKLEHYRAKTELARLLGLSMDPVALLLTDALPDPPNRSITTDVLLQAAAEHRMDLAAARQELLALAGNVELEKRRVFRVVQVGLEVEREARPSSSDGRYLGKALRSSIDAGELTLPPIRADKDADSDVLVGPSLTIELPLFDQNQAQIAKAEFAYKQVAKRVEALLVDVNHDARLARHRADAAWDIARYYSTDLLPLRQRSLDLASEAYRLGKAPLLSVLEAQRALQETRAGHIRALYEAALARVEIERVTALPMERLADLQDATVAPASAQNETND